MWIKINEWNNSEVEQGPKINNKYEKYKIWEADSLNSDNTIKIPKPVLDSLDKKFVWLKEQVIGLTEKDLGNLRELIEKKDYVKLEESLRKEIIEEQVEKGTYSLDTLSTWAKWTIPESVLKKVWTSIDSKLDKYKLDPKQNDNIKIWIVSKILNSWDASNILNSISTIEELFKKPDVLAKYNDIIDKNMNDIIGLLEKSNSPEDKELIDWLLSNPQEIEKYKYDEKIDLKDIKGLTDIKAMSPKDLTKYLSQWNNSVLNLEKKWWKLKENLIDSLSKMPSWLLEGLMGFIQKFLWFFLWKEWSEKIIWWFKKEVENRKSVDKLLQYWNTINEKWEIVPWENSDKIKLFGGKNLKWLESKKLSKFFDNCRSKWIDINSDDFWEKLNWDQFTAEKEEVKKDDKWAETKEKVHNNYTFSKVESDDIKGDNNSPDFTEFYKKLNNPNFIKDITKEKEDADKSKKLIADNEAKEKA